MAVLTGELEVEAMLIGGGGGAQKSSTLGEGRVSEVLPCLEGLP